MTKIWETVGRTRQSYYADISKKAKKRKNIPWGGRWIDGKLDDYHPENLNYKKRSEIKATGRRTYNYNTKYRADNWNSYGKKYNKTNTTTNTTRRIPKRKVIYI